MIQNKKFLKNEQAYFSKFLNKTFRNKKNAVIKLTQ